MFPASVYIERRRLLKEQVKSGLILFLGNEESPINFKDNQYSFRQDSSFLYYFGLDFPTLAAVIDVDQDKEIIFGNDVTVDEIIWMGPQPALGERCIEVGVNETTGLDKLQATLEKAVQQGKEIHFLPQYRAENVLKIESLLGIHSAALKDQISETLIRAIIAQRSVKSKEEVDEIEAALDVSYQMQTTAMKMSRPGMLEMEVVGAMEGIAISRGCRLAFPTIFSIHGETLHNHYYGNVMKQGDIAINDSGAESPLGYASDITRTIPIGGKFSQRQKEIYTIVLNAQEKAIEAIKPGVEFRQVHLLACQNLAVGLKEVGLMKGDIEEAVNTGAHTLFFQCGVGHMLGLDVHDMEALGEDYVGYTDTIKRNPEFGWKSLRIGKEIETGYVLTVEPGIYFIPELINRWMAQNENSQYIDYDVVQEYIDFGGIRIEDNVLVTEKGYRMLGKRIPKTISEVEDISSS